MERSFYRTIDIIECASLIMFIALLEIHRLKGIALFCWFITTIAILPSGLIKAVDKSCERVDEHAILFAPGLINLEKWPM